MGKHEKWVYVGRRDIGMNRLGYAFDQIDLKTGKQYGRTVYFPNPPIHQELSEGACVLCVYDSSEHAFRDVISSGVSVWPDKAQVALWQLETEISAVACEAKCPVDSDDVALALQVLSKWVTRTPVRGLRGVFMFILKQISK